MSRSRLVFTLGVLLGINTMNFFDRQILGAVAEPIRKEFNLDDLDLAWLNTAFIVLYAVVGVPLGRWADLGSRTRILALGVTLWSLMTALSALVQGFWSLFACRLGVGVGEASCAPAANSLLGDLFPAHQRARALSVFMLGLPVGLGLSFVVSGNIAHAWGWRAAFLIAGIPGLVLGGLALLLTEPARGAAETAGVGARRREGVPYLAILKIPTMRWIILSGALQNFNLYIFGGFLSPFLQRYHGLTVAEAGITNGIIYGVSGGVGITLGGWICDRAVRRRVSGRLEATAVALLLGIPCLLLALLQPQQQPWTCALWLLPYFLLAYMYYSGVYATIQDIVEPGLRGTAMAMYFLAMYLVAGFGPVANGALSVYFSQRAADRYFDGTVTEQARALGLHEALLYLVPALQALLVIVLYAGSRTVRRDHERLQQWMKSVGEGGVS